MNNQFMILLGAGSSRDYGFPLWSEVSELLELQFVEVREKNSSFSKIVNIPQHLWDENFALVEQCVDDVKKGKFDTIDAAVTQYCDIASDDEIFSRVFWLVMGRAFEVLVNVEGNTDSPLSILNATVENLSNNKPNAVVQFHIHYLFKEYLALAQDIESAIIVDFNYDYLFKFCYSRLFDKNLLKERIEMRKEEIKILIKKEEAKLISHAPDIVSFKNNINRQFSNIINAPIYENIDRLNQKLEQVEKEKLEPLLGYYQPHGTFNLGLGRVVKSRRKLWEFVDGQAMPNDFPKTCYEDLESRFTEINNKITIEQPTNLLILGISLPALKQNTRNINFPTSINKIYFTCYETEQTDNFVEFLSEKFPNCELFNYTTCSDLWDGLGQLYS